MKKKHLVLPLMCICFFLCITTANCFADDLQQGKSLMDGGDYDSAIKTFSKMAEARSANSTEATAMIGRCYQWKKDYKKAIDFYSQAISSKALPADVASDVKSSLGACYARQGEVSKAVAVFNELLKETPQKSYRWQYEISACYTLQGKEKNAIETLKAALPLAVAANDRGSISDIQQRLAFRYVSLRRFDDAIAVYQQLMQDDPKKSANWRYRIALCQKGKRQLNEALSVFTELASDPSARGVTVDAKFRLAECKAMQGKVDEAISDVEYVSVEHPQSKAEALVVLANIYSSYAHDYTKAIATLQKIISDYPENRLTGEVNELLGLNLLDCGKTADARAHFEKLVASEPENGEWQYLLAYSSYREGNWAEAKDALLAAYDKHQGGNWRGQAKYLYADCCYRLGDETAAKKAFTEMAAEFEGSSFAKEASIRLAGMESR